jgi:hypothetical protein
VHQCGFRATPLRQMRDFALIPSAGLSFPLKSSVSVLGKALASLMVKRGKG